MYIEAELGDFQSMGTLSSLVIGMTTMISHLRVFGNNRSAHPGPSPGGGFCLSIILSSSGVSRLFLDSGCFFVNPLLRR